MPGYKIRVGEQRDASEIARLFTELGHATDVTDLESRWSEWSDAGNAVLVAELPDAILAGVVTIGQMRVLHRPAPVGRITLLVVDVPMQGRGIGRELVAAAESMLIQRGCGLVEITSSFRFAEAHAFYEHLGYEKTGFRLAKVLQSTSA